MPCLKPPKREGECASSVRKGRCWVTLHWAGTARTTSPLDKNARICTTEPEGTKHPILQRRYLFSKRSGVRGWQDSRAVHDSRGLCSESGPFMARSSRGVFPNGCLRGFSDAWRAHPAKASSFRMHGAQILPRSPLFLVRGPFWDTWSEKIATDCRLGTHFTGILPSVSARNATAPCASTSCVAAPSMLAPNAPPMPYVPVAHALPAARHSTMTPCTVRGAFVAAEKVSCGLRVSMR